MGELKIQLEERIREEHEDSKTYKALSELAGNGTKASKILKDLAGEEKSHARILEDLVSTL